MKYQEVSLLNWGSDLCLDYLVGIRGNHTDFVAGWRLYFSLRLPLVFSLLKDVKERAYDRALLIFSKENPCSLFYEEYSLCC